MTVRTILAIGLVLIAAERSLSQVRQSGFEPSQTTAWREPEGGGTGGGHGTGEWVRAGERDFARTGVGSIRLSVWDDGNRPSVSWVSMVQKVSCQPRARLRAGASFYWSSSVDPLVPTGATAQLRIEYYFDEDGENLIPTRVLLSEPFSAADYPPDTWNELSLMARIPPEAHSLKFTMILLAENPGPQPQAVWLDDASLDFTPPSAFSHEFQRPSTPAKKSWWRRLWP